MGAQQSTQSSTFNTTYQKHPGQLYGNEWLKSPTMAGGAKRKMTKRKTQTKKKKQTKKHHRKH